MKKIIMSVVVALLFVFGVASNSNVSHASGFGFSSFLSSLSTEEKEYTVEVGDTIQLDVTAKYLNGTVEDATNKSKYLSLNSRVATINENGLITAKGKGKTAITIMYKTKLTKITVYVNEKSNEEVSE